MRTLYLRKGLPIVQIDNFPSECERSRKGAIYLRPDSSDQVTEGEFEHILKSRPDIKKFVQILEVKMPPKRPVEMPKQTSKGSKPDFKKEQSKPELKKELPEE